METREAPDNTAYIQHGILTNRSDTASIDAYMSGLDSELRKVVPVNESCRNEKQKRTPSADRIRIVTRRVRAGGVDDPKLRWIPVD